MKVQLPTEDSAWRRLLTNLPVGVAVYSVARIAGDESGQESEFEFRLVDANPPMTEILDRDLATIRESALADHFDAAEAELLAEKLAEAVRTSRRVEFEVSVPEPDGRCQAWAYPSDADHVVAVFHDVTELTRAEEASRQSELYRSAIEAMPDSVHVKDASARYVLVNARMARGVRLNKSQIIGRTALDVQPPEASRKMLADDFHVLETGEIVDAEETIPRDDGLHYAHVRKVPLRDESGSVIGIVTVSRDVTERHQMEVTLRESEERFRQLVENNVDGIFLFDAAGQLAYANPAAYRICGFPVGHLTLEMLQDGVREEHRGRFAATDDICRRGGIATIEFDVTRPDGTARTISATISPRFNSTGTFEGVFTVFKDVTDQRKAESELQQERDKLRGLVAELERKTRETTTLSEMGDLLQSCVTETEAYSVIAKMSRSLFPNEPGSLMMINSSRNLLEPVASWGGTSPDDKVYSPSDCWALRRGRVHLVTDHDAAPRCSHVSPESTIPYICVPMVAQGETLGILHLRCPESESDRPPGGWEADGRRQLASMVAEHLGLALANVKLRETLRGQAIRDSVTGLLNRRYLEETLEREIARAQRRGSSIGVIMIDIDRFKVFNDTYGHQAGDVMLGAVGNYLRTHQRPEDVACRYGGEEFVVVASDSALDDVLHLAERLREGIAELRIESRGVSLGSITISLGIAIYPDHAKTLEALLRVADTALYKAKNSGRNRATVAS